MKNIRNFIIVVGITIFIFPVLNGCKKGIDDPSITLKSRDARITAKWKLTSIIADWFSTSYDGTHYSGGMSKGAGTFEMEIVKDGTVTYSETCTPAAGTMELTTGTSRWWWNDTYKSKTYIEINGAGNTLFTSGKYYVDELKSKKLILKPTPFSTVKYIFEKE